MSDNTHASLTSGMITEKMVNIHTLIIFGVCLVFGIVNIAQGALPSGIVTLAIGVAVPVALHFIKKRASLTLCGTILSQVQLLAIILISAARHELHYMFPLMLASMSIAAIYYSYKNLIIHWAVMDGACLLGFIFKS
ncbi:MAG: hypothetical protein ACI4J5_04180, partial [Oscillospiraceae bacterium]